MIEAVAVVTGVGPGTGQPSVVEPDAGVFAQALAGVAALTAPHVVVNGDLPQLPEALAAATVAASTVTVAASAVVGASSAVTAGDAAADTAPLTPPTDAQPGRRLGQQREQELPHPAQPHGLPPGIAALLVRAGLLPAPPSVPSSTPRTGAVDVAAVAGAPAAAVEPGAGVVALEGLDGAEGATAAHGTGAGQTVAVTGAEAERPPADEKVAVRDTGDTATDTGNTASVAPSADVRDTGLMSFATAATVSGRVGRTAAVATETPLSGVAAAAEQQHPSPEAPATQPIAGPDEPGRSAASADPTTGHTAAPAAGADALAGADAAGAASATAAADAVAATGPSTVALDLAQRIEAIVEALEQAPPPRRITVDLEALGGLRLAVSLTGDTVRIDVLQAGTQLAHVDWQGEVATALSQRGYSLDGGGQGQQDQPEPEDRQPWQAPDQPRARSRVTFRPETLRPAAPGWQL